MRVTILSQANMLAKAHSQYDAKGSIVTPGCNTKYCLGCVSYVYSPTIFMLCSCNAIISYFEEREVLQQEYSQPQILPIPHFRSMTVLYLLYLNIGILTNLLAWKRIDP